MITFAKHIPNILTISRLFLVPLGLLIYANDYASAGVFVMAVGFSTDFFDGWLARKYSWQSDFGKRWDPVADGLTIMMLYLYIALTADFGDTINVILKVMFLTIFLRHFAVAMIYRKSKLEKGKVLKADKLGKISSWLQIFAVVSFFALSIPAPAIQQMTFIVLFFTGFIFSMLSAKDYFTKH